MGVDVQRQQGSAGSARNDACVDETNDKISNVVRSPSSHFSKLKPHPKTGVNARDKQKYNKSTNGRRFSVMQ